MAEERSCPQSNASMLQQQTCTVVGGINIFKPCTAWCLVVKIHEQMVFAVFFFTFAVPYSGIEWSTTNAMSPSKFAPMSDTKMEHETCFFANMVSIWVWLLLYTCPCINKVPWREGAWKNKVYFLPCYTYSVNAIFLNSFSGTRKAGKSTFLGTNKHISMLCESCSCPSNTVCNSCSSAFFHESSALWPCQYLCIRWNEYKSEQNRGGK